MKWKSQSLFDNAAEKSIIIIKFDVDNNTVEILHKKNIKKTSIYHSTDLRLPACIGMINDRKVFNMLTPVPLINLQAL